MTRGRRRWLLLHRWVAFGAGGLLVLQALTGGVLVYHRALDAWLRPDLFTARGHGEALPLDAIIEAARAAAPGMQMTALALPDGADGVFVVHLAAQHENEDTRSVEVMVDPTGAVLGARDADGHLVALLYELHVSLLLGDLLGVPDLGTYVVGAAGIVLMISVLSGLRLWWPRWSQIRKACTVTWWRGAKRLNFDVHRATGFWSAAVLLTLGCTGVALTFPNAVRWLVAAAATTALPPRDVASTPITGAAPISPARAVASATAAVAGGTPAWLDTPPEADAPYRVWLRRAGDVRGHGDTVVWMDRWTGAVLHVRDRRTFPAGEAVLHWQFPLHNGEAFGTAGRLVVCAAGVVPLILLVTGTLIWWRKPARRQPTGHRLTWNG